MSINLTVPQLAAILRLAEAKSFSRAAEALGVSQPALSRTLRQVEETIGARLFDRDRRNVELTTVGVEFCAIAKRLLGEFDGAFDELAQVVAGRRGRLVIAALPSIAAFLLPRAIAKFAQAYPDVEIEIRDTLSETVLNLVSQSEVDIGLTMRPVPRERLSYRELLEDRFYLVASAEYRLPSQAPFEWAVFGQHPFIAMSPSSSVRALTDAAFLQAGLTVKPLYQCAHLATTASLVAAGLGLTALPRLTFPLLAFTGLTAYPLMRPVTRRSLGLVTRTGRPPSPACKAFLSVIAREAAIVAKVAPRLSHG